MARPWKYTLLFLTSATVLTFAAVFTFPDNNLHLIFCNIGQGDAILIYRKNAQVLIDGGPGSGVLSCLAEHIPFWDRKVEFVVLSNSDADHYVGLVDVLRRYQVSYFGTSGVVKDDEGFRVLAEEVKKSGAKVFFLNESTDLRVGEITLDTIWPSRKFLAGTVQEQKGSVLGLWTESMQGKEVNERSVVFKLEYGEFDALLTGDIVPPATDQIGPIGPISVLKVPHHGSKNGLNASLVEATKPELAVISVGKNNRYGHPHKETIGLLSSQAVKTLRTDLDGEIEVVTDGKRWWVR